jgi:hypothetical protein
MASGGNISSGMRVTYSEEGVRVLCTKPVYGFRADRPDRLGQVLRRVTENVAEVLWEDRRSVQLLHIDFLRPATAIPPVAQTVGAPVPAPLSEPAAALIPADSPAVDALPDSGASAAGLTPGSAAPIPTVAR